MKFTLKHKNLFLLLIGLLAGIFLYNYQPFHQFLLSLDQLGYLGAFVAGILYDSTVTAATSVAILLILVEKIPRVELTLVAGMGAVMGDFFVFHLVKDHLVKEFKPVAESLGNDIGRKRLRLIRHILHTRYFHWLSFVVAVILIGSPLPNELGWGIMGTTKIKTYQVILLSLVVNLTGITLVLWTWQLLRP